MTSEVTLYGHWICPYATRVAVGWLAIDRWLAGDAPTRAEAVLLPLYVRLDGLRRLGFTRPLPAAVERHRQRCENLAGWEAVAWSVGQTDEFVGRFLAHRRRRRAAPA